LSMSASTVHGAFSSRVPVDGSMSGSTFPPPRPRPHNRSECRECSALPDRFRAVARLTVAPAHRTSPMQAQARSLVCTSGP
jgi:hypothetical protein